jgi:hypothetical protein
MMIVGMAILIVVGQRSAIRSTTVSVGRWNGTPKSPCSAFHMYLPYCTISG